jgi:predicted ATP-grasp superfamily ATP-dependent carboligase
MASKNKLRDAAVRIGSAVGRADAKAHLAAQKATKAAAVAKVELNELSKQVDALRKQLEKSAKKMKRALA